MLASGVVSFVVAAVSCALLVRYSALLGLIDEPNERSLHNRPVPRSGGIGILLGIGAGAIWLTRTGSVPSWAGVIAVAAVIVAFISLIDDYREVPPPLRLAVHLGASSVPVFCGLSFELLPLPGLVIPLPTPIGEVITVLFTAWLINLYNFMDGMDGFAGSMALIGFSALATIAALAGDTSYAALAAVVAGASLGFLLFNRPPASLFMGDVGSATLGFLVAVFALWSNRNGHVPGWMSVMIFSVFIVDATVTLIRRALKREAVWKAHRTHHYQRVVQAGWSHRRTTGAAILLMLASAGTALAVRDAGAAVAWTAIAIWLALYTLVAWLVRRMEDRHASGKAS